MNCPVCSQDSRVLKTLQTERRRECVKCGHRFTTKEILKEQHDRREKLIELVHRLQEAL